MDRDLVAPVEELIAFEDLPDHQLLSDLLQMHVDQKGKVDYAGFLKDREKLETYLQDLRSNPPQAGWTKPAQLAYWINTYNAFTIKLILDHYPVSSITDIDQGKPWDTKWIKLGEEVYSLNQIENEIIRPTFKEPRIHFAVNCAAKSCPPLANKAFTAENLNDLLEKQTRSFINDQSYNQISSNSIQISKIFEWYQDDFDQLIHFLNKYSQIEIKSSAKISYKQYDWGLNKQ